MRSDRRTILHLLSLGRLTPAEAERLLAATNNGDEILAWFVAGLAVIGMTRLHLLAERIFTAVLPGTSAVLHHVTWNLIHNLGGIL